MFTGTSNQGTHGAVTNAWATFFTMNNDVSLAVGYLKQ